MNYDEALDWVHSHPRLARRPNLSRMKKLLAALGNPQRRLRFVHIAGTNGKGSVGAMLSSVLCRAGYRTGFNPGPFITDFRERFQINGAMIDRAGLADVLSGVRAAEATLDEEPVEFEAVTAAAMLWFAESGCDIVCLEAGIGGRLDSTNVAEDTLVACITRIGLDHTELLGDTLREIAAEKCGILRPGRPVVSYPAQPGEAADEIARQAGAQGCPLIVPAAEDIVFHRREKGDVGTLFSNRVGYGGYLLDVPFPGRHQALNAAMVVEAALALWRQGFAVGDAHIVEGIRAARNPVRIEVLSREPLIIVDGAHNADGAKALAAALAEAGMANLTGVAGVMADKQAEEIVRLVAPYLGRLYAVAPGSPRAMPADELAALARPLVPRVNACQTVAGALEHAGREAGRGLLVFGSLYLAGQVRGLLAPG